MTGLSAFPSASHRRSRWVGRAMILPTVPQAPQPLRFFVLTVSMLGLQLVWSCEMAQASPYLLSLGVSKSHMAIVFLAGPLSGLIVQPVVGVLSDGCRSSLGRRRPFIIGGCIVSSFAVLLLGWSKEVAGLVAESGGAIHGRLTIALAILSVYVIDFSINVVQAMDRSLIVDVIAPHLQPAANAWASRMFGIGAVLGYWVGGLDLVYLTGGFLGGEQLKVLTFFTSFFLCGAHAITVVCVRERVLISREDNASPNDGSSPALRALGDIWTTLCTLPRPIQQVLNVQFSSWIGWFPVLFFGTTWVAEIYVQTTSEWADLASAPTELRDAATRAGTRAMLFHSIVSLATSIFLPPFIAGSGSSPSSSKPNSPYVRSSTGFGQGETLTERIKSMLPTMPIAWLSLPLLWTISNALFATLLLGTWFATSVFGASFIIAAAGFSWAVTNWAPFAILGDLILRIGVSSPSHALQDHSPNWATTSHSALSPILEEASDYEPSVSNGKTPLMTTPKAGRSTTTEDEEEGDWGFPNPRPEGRREDGAGKGEESMVGTPPSATSAYFDTSMGTPERSTFPRSSDDGEEDRRYRSSSPSPSPSPHHYTPRSRESSHPYEYPPNHDHYASNLSLGDHDPYSYASTSTILAQHGGNTPTVLQIRHSDDTFERDGSSEEGSEKGSLEEGDRDREERRDGRRGSAGSARGVYGGVEPPRITFGNGGSDEDDWEGEGDIDDGEGEGDGAGDQAGVILGCHNIYLVLPQFLVTALSSIIFALFAPHHSVIGSGGHPSSTVPVAPPNTTFVDDRLGEFTRLALRAVVEEEGGADWDALGMIFRIGGISAALSTVVCWRMWRERERERTGRRIRGTG